MPVKEKKSLKPLCKWSGGKRNEIPIFKKYYPKEYKRFVMLSTIFILN